jgi:hypothetical protein
MNKIVLEIIRKTQTLSYQKPNERIIKIARKDFARN